MNEAFIAIYVLPSPCVTRLLVADHYGTCKMHIITTTLLIACAMLMDQQQMHCDMFFSSTLEESSHSEKFWAKRTDTVQPTLE